MFNLRINWEALKDYDWSLLRVVGFPNMTDPFEAMEHVQTPLQRFDGQSHAIPTPRLAAVSVQQHLAPSPLGTSAPVSQSLLAPSVSPPPTLAPNAPMAFIALIPITSTMPAIAIAPAAQIVQLESSSTIADFHTSSTTNTLIGPGLSMVSLNDGTLTTPHGHFDLMNMPASSINSFPAFDNQFSISPVFHGPGPQSTNAISLGILRADGSASAHTTLLTNSGCTSDPSGLTADTLEVPTLSQNDVPVESSLAAALPCPNDTSGGVLDKPVFATALSQPNNISDKPVLAVEPALRDHHCNSAAEASSLSVHTDADIVAPTTVEIQVTGRPSRNRRLPTRYNEKNDKGLTQSSDNIGITGEGAEASQSTGRKCNGGAMLSATQTSKKYIEAVL
ncbi:predicted protein [Postia placenta Mad-698-R]|nr:predicted protein [Postia placenta Mad-698-R]